MMKKNCVFNWSGGKDSTLALHYILQQPEFDVTCLMTTVNELFSRISMHGVRVSLLVAQAESLGLPLHQIRLPEMPGMEEYEKAMVHHLNLFKTKGVTHSIFGDIFLEDLKIYREKKLAELEMYALFPLWKQDTTAIIKEFVRLGYKTVVVCAKEGLEDLCGRIIDESFLDDLPEGIDPCGENGEFHTFVFDGPIFKWPIKFELGERVFKKYAISENKESGFWFIDLLDSSG